MEPALDAAPMPESLLFTWKEYFEEGGDAALYSQIGARGACLFNSGETWCGPTLVHLRRGIGRSALRTITNFATAYHWKRVGVIDLSGTKETAFRLGGTLRTIRTRAAPVTFSEYML